MQKQCLFCGRFYSPDPRVKNQKACFRPQCKKARQQLAFNNWHRRNPNYFKGRYLVLKEWRKRNKHRKAGINDTKRVPARNSLFKLVLFIPGAFRKKVIQNEIFFKKIGRTAFFATGYS